MFNPAFNKPPPTMAQNAATFFVPMDDQENKYDGNSVESFSDALQTIYVAFKPQILELPNIAAVSTKAWKSQNTTVIMYVIDNFMFLISIYP